MLSLRGSLNYLCPLCGFKNEIISNSYIAAYLRPEDSYMQIHTCKDKPTTHMNKQDIVFKDLWIFNFEIPERGTGSLSA